IGISLGLLSAYAFLYVLLQVSRRFPRIARVYRIILLSCAALMVVIPFVPITSVAPPFVNLLLLALGLTTLAIGLLRAVAGDREALYFL
ncbi:hypothetical protein NL466_28080, partial [Klebsiella pneumoniae]|nr:hypothetical protein [Klebsiella pneumoniae]